MSCRLPGEMIGDVSHPEHLADGGLRIRDACPAVAGYTWVWPVAVPGGRVILVAGRWGTARRFDARTGELVGDPGQTWRVAPYRCAAATLPDGRTIFAAADEDGISRFDVVSGDAYPPTAAEQPFTIWDVAMARLPGGRVIIAGAGHDGLVYRWDPASGEPAGAPLERHPISVKAVTVAASAEGTPMLITGCEKGQILRWDAVTGARIGGPLPGTVDAVHDLALLALPAGRQMLLCVDSYALHRWDLATGQPIGSPLGIGKWADLVATHVDSWGIPAAFVWLPGEGEDNDAVERVERWRLDTAGRVEQDLPVTVRAVFEDTHGTGMVLGEPMDR